MSGWLRALLVAGLLGLLALFATGLQHDPKTIPSPLIGQPWPRLQGEDLAGQPALLAARGRPMLVNVWASWCVACTQEHPVLLTAAREFGAKIEFVGVDYRDTRAAAQAWLAARGNPYSWVYFDPAGRAGLELGVYGVPETYFVDRAGRIVHKHVGALESADLHRRLRALAGEAA